MSPTEPLEHIRRRASVPWREPEGHLTECGLMSANVAAVSFEEMKTKIRQQGRQRAGLSSCMTCWTVSVRYKSWEEEPIDAIRREVFGTRQAWDTFRVELLAIAALIHSHPGEFQGYVNALGNTVNLTEQRQARRKRKGAQ